jgi:hypothetical protein
MSAEIVGNQSVYWRIKHAGAPVITATGPGVNPGNNQVTTGGPLCNGHDPIPPANIGVSHGHVGQFLVTLRYKSLADAYAAGTWVGDNVRAGAGGFYLTITVPAITTRGNQNADPPAEIRVDW